MTYWTPDQLAPDARAEFDMHVRNNAYRYALETLANTTAKYDATVARWQSECAADGIDPERERDYYEIDSLAEAVSDAVSTAVGLASR